MNSLPLTKSRFKLAMECPTKLYYESRGEAYSNQRKGNEFLAALADGGHQVGALAKFLFHTDPTGQSITVEESDHDKALVETQRRLQLPGKQVIAEAALKHGSYFARVDILVRDADNKRIEVIEVKSKSASPEDFESGLKAASWRPYLYDVAFQAEIAALEYPDWEIVPKLVLLDKSVACDVNGLHQQFKVRVEPGSGKVSVDTRPGLKRTDLGSLNLVKEVDVSAMVKKLREARVPAPNAPAEHTSDLPTFMKWTAQLQHDQTRFFEGMSKACKDCEFRAKPGDERRSGLHECMKESIARKMLDCSQEEIDPTKPMSFDLWGGDFQGYSLPDVVLKARRALLADVQEEDIDLKRASIEAGFSPHERRLAQIRAVKDTQYTWEISQEKLAEMDRWEWPLHMIDFETAAPALPFFEGTRPFETIAFQFSHHVMSRDEAGRITIRHANQFISTQPGVQPNVEFVRSLRKALMPDGALKGTVFRYHNHENTILTKLREKLKGNLETDLAELLAFIDLVIKDGPKAMVDLHKFVKYGYFSANSKGSLSLKDILPAILGDAKRLKDFYSKDHVYGRGLLIESLNFNEPDGHVWVREDCQGNPYRTLPPIFGSEFGKVNDMMLRLAGEDGSEGGISNGGAAMTAYNYMQYSDLPASHRSPINDALLRYCELDTLAMVMLVQGLMELRDKPLRIVPGD